MADWPHDAVFYHIYPLGLCGAPEQNDFSSPATHRLRVIHDWLDHIQWLGANALYLGPLFESSRHGYDTVDYYHVDRRLGNNETLSRLSDDIHRRGMRLILDGVFNHVGRDFWAFYQLKQQGKGSPYQQWFHNLRFGERSPYGDPFAYEGWNGHHSLVKLDLAHPKVREHLFDAIRFWVEEWGIDGLRLDAADCLELDFLRELAAFCRSLRSDFWLMGEIIHGDYRLWANDQMLDAVTNYECYKGLYSSHNDHNYYEIGYALNRQFGAGGLYQGLPLYNFCDNHDVNRLAGDLCDREDLYLVYALLFTMPGVPSIYYGSEWGLDARRTERDDRMLRPTLSLEMLSRDQEPLPQHISRLAAMRHRSHALRRGDYRQLLIAAEQLAFMRQADGSAALVLANASHEPAWFDLTVPLANGATLVDGLDERVTVQVQDGKVALHCPPKAARILLDA